MMPTFNNCNGFSVHDSTFYQVSGDVNLHTQQQLMIGDTQAQTAGALHTLPGPNHSTLTVEPSDYWTGDSRRATSGVARSLCHANTSSILPRESRDYDGHITSTSSTLIPSPWPSTFNFLRESVSEGNPQYAPQTEGALTLLGRESLLSQTIQDYSHYSLPEVGSWPNGPDFGRNSLASGPVPNDHMHPLNHHIPRPLRDPTSSIRGGTFITAQNVNNDYRQGETGINILHRAVALEALHDSNDNFPQPKCHPETREEMLNDLWKYATDPERPDEVLWLHGPAGAGKSAIMSSLCERLDAVGRLGGTFFFKRGHPTRGNAKALFSTIAYRLALRIPRLKGPISRAVEQDPSLVAGTPEIQMWQLILGPLKSLSNQDPPVIIIDGLDECEGHQMQQEILHILHDCFRQQILVRIIISSRPEAHITKVTLGAYKAYNVRQSFADVRKYLADEFARIHDDHPATMSTIPRPWPSDKDMDTLVQKSSGHFIYASTIIKFIGDPNFRPTERLAMVLGNHAEPDLDSPFAGLDQLYTQILDSSPRKHQLPNILRVINQFHMDASQIDQLLKLQPGDTVLALRGLHSLIDHPEWSILRFEHASFADFLCNPTRSGKYYVGGLTPSLDLTRLILNALSLNDDKHVNPSWSDQWGFGSEHFVWTIGSSIKDVCSIPPSAEFVALIRSINPVFLFIDVLRLSHDRQFISWLQEITPLPTDLTQLWEDYFFMELTRCCAVNAGIESGLIRVT
ncbi:hypothetical protein C8J57DRAFT_1733707 [Mycena rebaudengoi]|nr:hypothetical protein C8J57DRAFT_1733707 [Mycena rebaudengoi]